MVGYVVQQVQTALRGPERCGARFERASRKPGAAARLGGGASQQWASRRRREAAARLRGCGCREGPHLGSLSQVARGLGDAGLLAAQHSLARLALAKSV
jgi:hypothetical protein